MQTPTGTRCSSLETSRGDLQTWPTDSWENRCRRGKWSNCSEAPTDSKEEVAHCWEQHYQEEEDIEAAANSLLEDGVAPTKQGELDSGDARG